MTSRTGSPIDVTIDATGALLGVLLYRLLARKKEPR